MTASFEDTYREIDRYLQEAQNELGLAFSDLPPDESLTTGHSSWREPPDVTNSDRSCETQRESKTKNAVDFEAIFRAHNLLDARKLRKRSSPSRSHAKKKDDNNTVNPRHKHRKAERRSSCEAGMRTGSQNLNIGISNQSVKEKFTPGVNHCYAPPPSLSDSNENKPTDKCRNSRKLKVDSARHTSSQPINRPSVQPDLISHCDHSSVDSNLSSVRVDSTLVRNKDSHVEKDHANKNIFCTDEENGGVSKRQLRKLNDINKRHSQDFTQSQTLNDVNQPQSSIKSRKPDISAVFNFIESQIRRNIHSNHVGCDEPYLQDKNVFAALTERGSDASFEPQISDSDFCVDVSCAQFPNKKNVRNIAKDRGSVLAEKRVPPLSPLKHPATDIKFIDDDEDDGDDHDENFAVKKDEDIKENDAGVGKSKEIIEDLKSESLDEDLLQLPSDVELRRKSSEPIIDWLALRQKRLSPIFDCEHSDVDSQHYYCLKVNEDINKQGKQTNTKFTHRRSGSLNVDGKVGTNADSINDFDVFLSRKTIRALEELNMPNRVENISERCTQNEQPQEKNKKKESKLTLLQKRLRKRSAPPSMAALFRRKSVDKGVNSSKDQEKSAVIQNQNTHNDRNDPNIQSDRKESISTVSTVSHDECPERGYLSDNEPDKPKSKDHGFFHSLRRSASKRFHRKSPARSVPVVIIQNKNAHEDDQKLVVSPSGESMNLFESQPPSQEKTDSTEKEKYQKEKESRFNLLKKRLRKRSAPPSLATFHRFFSHGKTAQDETSKGVCNAAVDICEPVCSPTKSVPLQPPGSASILRKNKWLDGFRTAPLPRKNSKKRLSKDGYRSEYDVESDCENRLKYGATPLSCSCDHTSASGLHCHDTPVKLCPDNVSEMSNVYVRGHHRKFSAPEMQINRWTKSEQCPPKLSSQVSSKRYRNRCQEIRVPSTGEYSSTTLPKKSSHEKTIELDDEPVSRSVSEIGIMYPEPLDYTLNMQTFPRLKASPTRAAEVPPPTQNSLLDSLHRKYYSHQYERRDIKLGTRAYKRSPEQSGKSESESDHCSSSGPISPKIPSSRQLSVSSTSLGNRSSRESSPGVGAVLKVSESMNKYATSSLTLSMCSCPHHLDSDGGSAHGTPTKHVCSKRSSLESDSNSCYSSNTSSLRSNKSTSSRRSRQSFDASNLHGDKTTRTTGSSENVRTGIRRHSCDNSEEYNETDTRGTWESYIRLRNKSGHRDAPELITNGSLRRKRDRTKSCERIKSSERESIDQNLEQNQSSLHSSRDSVPDNTYNMYTSAGHLIESHNEKKLYPNSVHSSKSSVNSSRENIPRYRDMMSKSVPNADVLFGKESNFYVRNRAYNSRVTAYGDCSNIANDGPQNKRDSVISKKSSSHRKTNSLDDKIQSNEDVMYGVSRKQIGRGAIRSEIEKADISLANKVLFQEGGHCEQATNHNSVVKKNNNEARQKVLEGLFSANKDLDKSWSAQDFFNDSSESAEDSFQFRFLAKEEDFSLDSNAVEADDEFDFERILEERLEFLDDKSSTLKQSDFNLSEFAESGDSDNDDSSSSSSSRSTLCSENDDMIPRKGSTEKLRTSSNSNLNWKNSGQVPGMDENSNETMSLDRAMRKKSHAEKLSPVMGHCYSVADVAPRQSKKRSEGFVSLKDMARDLKSLMTEKELAEIEAIEACRWLRAAGFPQYAQMYEDQQFPIDLGVVEKDHDFLDKDQLQSLFRRLNTLNRCTNMKIDTSARKSLDESDDEDQCALSDKWKFQRSNRRWSRKELEDTTPIPVVVVDTSASQIQPITSCSSHDSVLTDNDSSGHLDESPKLPPKSLPIMSHLSPGDGLECTRLHSDDQDDDDINSPRLRRAASEKVKGAKTFFKRMESLKGSKRKKKPISKDGIGSPTLTDVDDMQARVERLNCVDIGSADEMSPPLSPSIGQYSSMKAFSDTDCSPVHERCRLQTPGSMNASRSDNESLGSQIRHKRNLSDLGGATGFADNSNTYNIPKVLSNGYVEAGSGSFNYRTGSFNLGNESCEKDEMLERIRRRTESTRSASCREHRVSFYDNVTPDESDPQQELDKVLQDLFQNINSLANFGSDEDNFNFTISQSEPSGDENEAFTIPGISIDSPDKTSSPVETTPCYTASVEGEEQIQFDFDNIDESAVFEADNLESPCSDVPNTRHITISTTDTSSAPETISDLESPISPDDGSTSPNSRERRDSGVGSSLTRTPSSERRRPRIRWHSFQKSHRPSLCSRNLQISSHSAGQLMVLRKLALLKLTGIMDKYSPSNRTGWSWAMPKFIKRFRAPDYKDKNVFGVPLLVMLQRTVQPLPQCILYAMRHLRRTAPEQVGIFRKSGVKSRIQKLRNQLESNPDMVNFESIQEYDVADLLKQYFRELPECLMTNKFSEIFISIYMYLPPDQRLEACQSAIMLMPDENREVLQSLLLFLSDLAQHSEKNQMNASNLAVCFAPSIFNILRSTDNRSATNSPKRSRKHGGSAIPDQKELVEQRAAHECLKHMITECKKFFMIHEDSLKKCRFSYIEQGDPSTLEELCKCTSDGKPNFPAYIESCIQGVLKESREKFKGWVSVQSDTDVDLSFKKVGDGHPLRLWKCAVDVEAPPIEVLNRVLRERHLWDEDLLKWRSVERLDKETEVFQYVRNSMAPHPTRDHTVLRSWRTDLPKGACCLVATSVDHPEAPLLGGVRGVVLASRYLIEPCGAGKSRLTHMCRIDTRGRTPEWYNKAFGHICVTLLIKVKESFKHSTPTHGPETKV